MSKAGIRRNWIVASAVALSGGYLGYRLYYSEYLAARLRKWNETCRSLSLLSDALASTSDIAACISSDLQNFVHSDADEIPRSVRQVLKLLECQEFQRALAATTNSVSLAGQGFVTVLVNEAVRTLVRSSFECSRESSEGQDSSNLAGSWASTLFEIAGTDKARSLVTDCIAAFASSAVSTFLEQTASANMCEDMLTSMTSPANREPVRDLLTSVCGGAMESLVRASHDVLSQDPETSAGKTFPRRNLLQTDYAVDMPAATPGYSPESRRDPESASIQRLQRTSKKGQGWTSEVGQLLAVPETRKLVLEVAGTISSQGVRAFLAICISMLPWNSSWFHRQKSDGFLAARY